MSPVDLLDKCVSQQQLHGREDAVVILVLPGPARSERKRLAGRSGPYGEVLAVNSDGGVVTRFAANSIIDWLFKVDAAHLEREATDDD